MFVKRFRIIAGLLLSFAAATQSLAVEPLVITADTTLDPAKTYGPIIIKASNITIDGRSAWLIGAKEGNPKNFKGTGIRAEGVVGVTLKNVNAKGFETGLHLIDCKEWAVEGCNFSDNFHDPEFGWGEQGRRGGMLLERVSKSKILKNKANRVWDAFVLLESNDNHIEANDFSRTSNTGLKMWNASRNKIVKNNFSYGIRKNPGEVHARDSTSVLMESGSNDNHLIGNDCTHGGDGIFVRVLNNWVSTGNVFEENDCSYANNNCVEAWSPRNTWRRNKANHGSYGFWLGASDQNVVEGNEASFNGLPTGQHNSPHLPGNCHAGIVFMAGPSSHTIVRGNTCKGNNGAGIAAIGDEGTKGKKWNAFHWIIEQNVLEKNRWGIYLQHSEMIDVAANRFAENTVANVHVVENVAGLKQWADRPDIKQPPRAKLNGPQVVKVGEKVTFDASESKDDAGNALSYRWRIAPEVNSDAAKLTHSFAAPGFQRLALTVNNGLLSDLAWRDLYVVEDVDELATEGQSKDWSWIDPRSKVKFTDDEEIRLIGKSSLRANVGPYSGGRVTLAGSLSGNAALLTGKSRLVFWLKARNEGTPAWQDLNPLITLVGVGGKELKLAPVRDMLSQPPYNEARDGWTYFSVPLAGDATWKREGSALDAVKELRFGFDSWGAPPLVIWLDGVGLK